jgi:hypothetical protein
LTRFTPWHAAFVRLAVGPFLAAGVLLASGACAADAPDGPPPATVRDSAGVTIVENPALSEVATLDWSVGESPQVSIGMLEGPEEYQLFQVMEALRLADGRLAVANAGSGEVRVYDASGVHLASWGGEGDGPGEFRHTTRLVPWPGSDSLAVWDMRLSRLTLFDATGAVGRTQTFPGVGDIDRPGSLWSLPDGNLVLMGVAFPDPEEMVGLLRTPEVFAVAGRDGSLVASIGDFPGLETWMQFTGEGLNIVRLPLSRRNVSGQVGQGMVIASNERFQLDFYGAEGDLHRSVRVATPPTPVTAAMLETEVEHRAANMPEEARPGYRASLQDMPTPETLPVFVQVLEDAVGNVWVRLFSLPSQPGPAEWAVFDPTGQIVGRMQTPDGLEVFQIGEDFILGSMEDALEVEHVQIWPLSR